MNSALRSIRLGLLAAFLGLAPAAGLLADTIYLKNGRKIEASNIVRQEGKLTFDADGGSVTLSESLVDHIEGRIESDDPGRAPIAVSKPQAAPNAAPSSRPKAATPDAAPLSRPKAATPEATTSQADRSEPAALKIQQRPSSLAVGRPMPAPIARPTAVRDADAGDMQQAVLVLPGDVPDALAKIADARPAAPREANTWFLTDSPAIRPGDPRSLNTGLISSANAGTGPNAGPNAGTNAVPIVRPVQVGSFPGIDLESKSTAENRPKEARVVPPGTFETVKMAAPPQPGNAAIQSAQGPVQGVVVLSGPNPSYTEEARSLGIEGQVLLDVVFQASGQVKVNGVLKGLGHGLDDESVRAAQQIRFTPAMQQGRPVDFPATLHIVFNLAF